MILRTPKYVVVLSLLVLFCLFAANLVARSPVPSSSSGTLPVLAPKLQKELGKALEALRANRPSEARKHLDSVYRVAPTDADANFLFGIYSSQMNDWLNAKGFWLKVLSSSPGHLGALLSLGDALLREGKPAEAAPYFYRAVEAEPTSWRAHAALAEACMRQGLLDESITQAERALELGHSQAEIVLPLLARALYLHGDQQRAALVFQAYLQEHQKKPAASNLFASFESNSMETGVEFSSELSVEFSLAETAVLASTALPSNWLPPDIDETVPPVEPGAACNLEEVLEKSGKRIQELIANVDQFTATEAVTHEAINKWGFASSPAKFEFDYIVSIKEAGSSQLNVDEYRDSHYSSTDFPDHIATTGLPALVLIFHPYYARNYAMTCEGLAHSKQGLAWQVYFRQRADKPSTIRNYQVGARGPVYPVSLKGRAWISADTFQIIRLETDIMSPLPEIRLVADHTAIEYGPVHFKSRNLDMWLPQTAEVYYDWRGRRSHRRHSFRNYLLYAVDDKQRISVPDADAPGPPSPSGDARKPNT
jgi:tetratricopeptide (TPR) repeat protein